MRETKNGDGACPVKWSISELNADSNTVAIESVGFVHNSIKRWENKKAKAQFWSLGQRFRKKT
jgi:hypothetical protein